MKIVLDNSKKDYKIFVSLIGPHVQDTDHYLSDLFRGLKLRSSVLIKQSLDCLGMGTEECENNYCTFTSVKGFRFFMEQVGKEVEIEITLL